IAGSSRHFQLLVASGLYSGATRYIVGGGSESLSQSFFNSSIPVNKELLRYEGHYLDMVLVSKASILVIYGLS
ncbi:hypothetical protein Ocin01_00441, partial [Orchesella cincta]